MKAKSIKGKSQEEISKEINKSISDGFKPTLAVVFSSVSQDRKAICQTLTEAGIQIFGLTTNGEFIDEETERGSVVILLLEMDKDSFHVFLREYPQQNYREVAQTIARLAKDKFENPAFLIGISHAAVDGEDILLGLEDVIGKDINAFGGAAGDDYRFKETYVFTNGMDSNQGMVCLAMDQSKIKFKGVATCGWKAVGTEKTVTRSEGNHVYTIDGMPAAEITAKYGGLDLSPENQEHLVELAANFPLQLQREHGDPVMRPGLVVDWNDFSFYTSGKVPQGSKVRFSVPPDWDVMQKVITGVENLKATEMPEADALVVFSCAGRVLSFGPMMNAEIEGVRKVWNVPMAGMFSNAELGKYANGSLEMHNLTTCCIALKEI
jgi:hypothetical protein